MTGPRAWLLSAASVVAIGLLAFGTAKLALGAEKPSSMLCLTPEKVATILRDEHGEHPTGSGVQNSGSLLQIWESDGGKTWSAVVTLPTRVACIVAAGSSWSQETKPAGDPS